VTEQLATIDLTDPAAPSQNGARVSSPVFAPPADRWTMLWRAKVWIVLAAVIAGAGTYMLSKKMAPIYSASIVVQVQAPAAAGLNPNEVVLASNNLAAEYAQLSKTAAVIDPAAAQLHIPSSALGAKVTGSVLANQNLIQIGVQSSSRSGSIAGATAVAKSLQTYVNGSATSSATIDVTLRKQSLDAQIFYLTTEIQVAQTDAQAALQAATGTPPGSAALTVANQREAYVTQLSLQRSTLQAQRQGFASAPAQSNGSIIPVGGASGASQVEPKPTLYAAVALIVAALIVAQLAVFVGTRRQLRAALRGAERS
jgi:capsular polysaccharide biosynthesis protein